MGAMSDLNQEIKEAGNDVILKAVIVDGYYDNWVNCYGGRMFSVNYIDLAGQSISVEDEKGEGFLIPLECVSLYQLNGPLIQWLKV